MPTSNSTGFQGLLSFLDPPTPKPDPFFPWPGYGSSSDPNANRWTSSLTRQSLEMCTETLGNESGSSIDLTLDEYSYLVVEKQSCSEAIKPRKSRKKMKQRSVFPPPLSSISGGDGVRVEARREGDGRLLITASRFRADGNCFKTERENGRLRLFLVMERKVEMINGEKLGCKREMVGCNKKLSSLPVCVASS